MKVEVDLDGDGKSDLYVELTGELKKKFLEIKRVLVLLSVSLLLYLQAKLGIPTQLLELV